MTDTLSPAMAFSSPLSYCPPQATVSLSETSLDMSTPVPTTPGSTYTKSEINEDGEPKKPTKKRKSWGQELPTPKTNLPPRKRAKTEDEKEQRRIERVLRNRQAAQSSRERKRLEVEKLEGEKSSIEQQNESLKQRLLKVEHEKFLLSQQFAKLAAQMRAIQNGKSPAEISPPLDPDFLDQDEIKQELDEHPFSLSTPALSHYGSSSSFSGPPTATGSSLSTPATTSLDFDALTPSPDMTQHPAVSIRGKLPPSSFAVYEAPTQPPTALLDPIIFDDGSNNGNNVLSDYDFCSLFATDGAPEYDSQFFKDGLGAAAGEIDDGGDANGFTFDSLVDLDACGSHPNNFSKNTNTSINGSNNNHNNDTHIDIEDFAHTPRRHHDKDLVFSTNNATNITTASPHPSHQNAATSSAQQPCFGAPS